MIADIINKTVNNIEPYGQFQHNEMSGTVYEEGDMTVQSFYDSSVTVITGNYQPEAPVFAMVSERK